ncbi:hypothetical protein ACU8V4_09550 [Pseudoalteromonas mariniglutinosa]
MEISYKIYCKGEITSGENHENVVAALSDYLGISLTASRLLFDGKTRCISKNLSKQEALRRYNDLNKMGIKISLKKLEIEPTSSNDANDNQNEKVKDLKGTYKQAKQTVTELKDKLSEFSKNNKHTVTDDGALKNSAKNTNFEDKYFVVTRYFSFITATLSLLLAAILVCVLIFDYLDSNKIKSFEESQIEFNTFKNQLEDTEKSRYSSAGENELNSNFDITTAQELQLEYNKKVDMYFSSIEQNINVFANATKDISVKEYGSNQLKNTLKQVDSQYSIEPYHFFETLLEFTEDLGDSGDFVSSLKDGDTRKINWIDSVTWFINNYKSEISSIAESKRYAESKNSENQEERLYIAILIGLLFGGFVTYTMVLALLRIEKNTRPTN